jgi:hypothetical protein
MQGLLMEYEPLNQAKFKVLVLKKKKDMLLNHMSAVPRMALVRRYSVHDNTWLSLGGRRRMHDNDA